MFSIFKTIVIEIWQNMLKNTHTSIDNTFNASPPLLTNFTPPLEGRILDPQLKSEEKWSVGYL